MLSAVGWGLGWHLMQATATCPPSSGKVDLGPWNFDSALSLEVRVPGILWQLRHCAFANFFSCTLACLWHDMHCMGFDVTIATGKRSKSDGSFGLPRWQARQVASACLPGRLDLVRWA